MGSASRQPSSTRRSNRRGTTRPARRSARPINLGTRTIRASTGVITMPLVEINALTKEYQKGTEKIVPLKDVSLAIDKGDFVSLMGASGSGKSTLLNLIAGIDKPSAGTIHVAGTDIAKLSRTQLAHWRASHVGYIFQLYN